MGRIHVRVRRWSAPMGTGAFESLRVGYASARGLAGAANQSADAPAPPPPAAVARTHTTREGLSRDRGRRCREREGMKEMKRGKEGGRGRLTPSE
jgi:hypothetical protein